MLISTMAASLAAAAVQAPAATCPTRPDPAAASALLDSIAERRVHDGVAWMSGPDGIWLSEARGIAVPGHDIAYVPEQRVRTASISKMLTAIMVHQLVEEGAIGYGDTLAELLPGVDLAYAEAVQLHHLLSHSSGIPNMQYSDEADAYEAELLLVEGAPTPPDMDRWIAIIGDEDLSFAPGTDQSYSNSNYMLLEQVVMTHDGGDFERSLQRRLYAPLGLEDSGKAHFISYVPGLAMGRTRTLDGWYEDLQRRRLSSGGVGSLYASGKDMLTLFNALWAGDLFRHPATLERMKPQPGKMFGMGLNRVPLMVAGTEVDAIGHDGWSPPHSAMVARLPGCGVSLFVSDSSAAHYGAARRGDGHGEIFAIAEGLVALGLGETPKTPQHLLFERFADRVTAKGYAAALAGVEEDLDTLDVEAPPRDLAQIGAELLERGKDEEARSLYAMAVPRYPDDINLNFGRAAALLDGGDTAGAVAAYDRVLELLPADHQARGTVEAARAEALAGSE